MSDVRHGNFQMLFAGMSFGTESKIAQKSALCGLCLEINGCGWLDVSPLSFTQAGKARPPRGDRG